jgi:hypothetical protein
LGREVEGDGPMTSSLETVIASGEFTGRKAAAIATKSRSVLDAILLTVLPLRRMTLGKYAGKMPTGVQCPGRTGTTRSRSGNRYPRMYNTLGTALI